MTQVRGGTTLRVNDPVTTPGTDGVAEVLSEETFRRRIAVERKRTERRNDPFLLMLLQEEGQANQDEHRRTLEHVAATLLSTIRETDVIGWYKEDTTLAVMFTGLAACDKTPLLSMILSRVTAVLRSEMTPDQFRRISISFHFFPDDWNHDSQGPSDHLALYPDVKNVENSKRLVLGVKRSIDVVGSALLMILCIPLCAAIAIAIKMTSKGPVFFRQQRVGQFGRRFTFFKFRSMYVDSDHAEHEAYVTRLIAGNAERISLSGRAEAVFKLANDRRITPVGKLLRRSSLDELPQFLNVLRGDMSLVGPRPPVPYELAAYETWHRRRLLLVKPGITGLWQVEGRNRIPFDQMVRLDLHYATSWTPLMDLKILMRTPSAVIRGAY